MMEANDVGRSAETPRRSRSRSRRSLTRGRDRDSSRRSPSYCRRLQDREEALKKEQKRVRQLELELQRERDAEQHRQRSVRRGSTQRPTRDARSRSRSRSHNRSRGRHRSSSRVFHGHHRGDSKRSCSPLFSSKDVTQIIQSIKDIFPSQPGHSTQISNRDSKNIIPEFNPSEKNQRMDIWLKKVNECAMVYGWDERSTVHFAMQKLSGLAKIWYESQSSILYSWSEWQTKLLNAFPCEQNYGQLLEDMLKRKSRINEPIQNYFYEKLSLL
ncbi:serine/arginine-rich splicing factor 4-like, partial [Zerene cesonia]|uniref:serine/arginine-rich splicing factor 4-like n=1 Tax=Zerene cesonia TaxID=33412 RepID=UPI0018E4E750